MKLGGHENDMKRLSVPAKIKSSSKTAGRPICLVGFSNSYGIHEHGLLILVTQLSKPMMRARISTQESATVTVDTIREKTSLANAHYLGARLSILEIKTFFLSLLRIRLISLINVL